MIFQRNVLLPFLEHKRDACMLEGVWQYMSENTWHHVPEDDDLYCHCHENQNFTTLQLILLEHSGEHSSPITQSNLYVHFTK